MLQERKIFLLGLRPVLWRRVSNGTSFLVRRYSDLEGDRITKQSDEVFMAFQLLLTERKTSDWVYAFSSLETAHLLSSFMPEQLRQYYSLFNVLLDENWCNRLVIQSLLCILSL